MSRAQNPRMTYPEVAIAAPFLIERFKWLRKWTVKWARGDSDWQPGDPIIDPNDDGRSEVNALVMAEAVSSEDVKTGKHHVLIDIDKRCILTDSTHVGHYHLYVELGMMGNGVDWEAYEKWLEASAEIGLIERGYYEASKRRRGTFIRLPWIRKGSEVEDRHDAMGAWLEEEVPDALADILDVF